MAKPALEYTDKDGRAFPGEAWIAVYWTHEPGRWRRRLILALGINNALDKAQALLPGIRLKSLTHIDLWR